MKLPEKYENKNTLENMEDYTSLYIVPRAMRVDTAGECHLNEAFPGSKKPWWTEQLKITKVPEWYIVHINEMAREYSWDNLDEPPMGMNLEKSYGKIVEFTIDQYCKKYSVSPKLFPSLDQEVMITPKNNTVKDIIKTFKNNLMKN